MKTISQLITESAEKEIFSYTENIITTAIWSNFQKELLPNNEADISELAKLCEKLSKADPDRDNVFAVVKHFYSPGGSPINKVRVLFIDKTADFGRAGSSPIAQEYKGLMFGTDTVIMQIDDKLGSKPRSEDWTFHKLDNDFVKNLWNTYKETREKHTKK